MENEYFTVVRALRKHHALFAAFWTVGTILEIDHPQMPTAAIVWDKETGAGVQFLINPQFWATLNAHSKAFVIAHEIMHVYLDHGRRSLGLDPTMANIAQDVVINHYLVDRFDFDRAELTFGESYCWRDTIFPDRKVEPDRCFEYYYEQLQQQGGAPQDGQSDEGGEGEPGQGQNQTVDVHNFMDGELDNDLLDAIQEAVDDLMDRITPESVEDFQDMIDKGNKDEAKKVEEEKEKNQGAGSMAGTLKKRIQLGRVKKKRKWETVVQDVLGRFQGMERDVDIDLWTRPNRRLTAFEGELILPAEINESVPVRDRIDVWFFQDTSGSCVSYAERFFKAAASIPEDRFRIRGFCFDTRTFEVDFRKGELQGFGGTAFQPIENRIQQTIQKEGCAYPQAVFVITDGYGSRVTPQHPDRWHWFMTDGHSTSYIPQESSRYLLKDYE